VNTHNAIVKECPPLKEVKLLMDKLSGCGIEEGRMKNSFDSTKTNSKQEAATDRAWKSSTLLNEVIATLRELS